MSEDRIDSFIVNGGDMLRVPQFVIDDVNRRLDDAATVPAITTRHVGTIAFQGTDAQINEAMKKWLGGVK